MELYERRPQKNERRLLEKYNDMLFKDELDGGVEDRIITGILWNKNQYMLMTKLIDGSDDGSNNDSDDVECCINDLIRVLICN